MIRLWKIKNHRSRRIENEQSITRNDCEPTALFILAGKHDTVRSGAKAILLRDESLVSAGVVPNVIHLEGWVELVKAIDFDGRYEVTIRRVPTF
jgi:hypothetical protein